MHVQLTILVALCLAEILHNSFELWGMKQKVSWLSLVLDKLEHGNWPMNINTKLKAVIFHIFILIVSSWLFYIVLRLLHLSDQSLVFTGIVLLVANYIYTTWNVDNYHTQIGKLITKVKKRG